MQTNETYDCHMPGIGDFPLGKPFPYRGFAVTLHQDCDASAPWEMTDHFSPVVFATYGYGGQAEWASTVYQDAAGDTLRDVFDIIPRRIQDSAFALIPVLQATGETLDSFFRFGNFDATEFADANGEGKAEFMREYIADVIDGASNGNASDYLDMLESVYTAAGVPAATFCLSGNHPSDYADCLLVLSDAFREQVGLPVDTDKAAWLERELSAAKDQMGAYWEGDVWGVTIDRLHGLPDDPVDAGCWGLVGCKYAAEFVNDEIDYLAQADARKEAERLFMRQVMPF